MPGGTEKGISTILTQGGKELPEIPQRRGGKRGRVAKSFGHNLHEALLELEESVLRFMSDPDVSFTNNGLSKKSGCQRSNKVLFRTERFAHAWCRYRVISIQWQNSDKSTRRHPGSRLTVADAAA